MIRTLVIALVVVLTQAASAQQKAQTPPDVWPVALDPEGPVYCMDVNRLLPDSLAGSLAWSGVAA